MKQYYVDITTESKNTCMQMGREKYQRNNLEEKSDKYEGDDSSATIDNSTLGIVGVIRATAGGGWRSGGGRLA